MFSAVGPDLRVARIRASSASHQARLQVEEAERGQFAALRVEEHRAQRFPGDRAAAESGDDRGDDRVPVRGDCRRRRRARTSAVTMPPLPGASARSRTTTRHGRQPPARTARTDWTGNGRKLVMPSAPARMPSSRSSSIVSLTVPSTEPRATMISSASSVR